MPDQPEAATNARDWLTTYAARLDVPPLSTEQFRAILDLAAEAAHASERVAAPAACWLAARAGVDLDQALAQAKAVAADG